MNRSVLKAHLARMRAAVKNLDRDTSLASEDGKNIYAGDILFLVDTAEKSISIAEVISRVSGLKELLERMANDARILCSFIDEKESEEK